MTLSGHTGWVGTLSFSLDGTLLVSGSNDETLKLWDVQTGGVVKTFHGHINRVFSVSISADHTIIVSGSEDQTIRLWNVQMGECYHVMEQQRQVYHVSFSPTNPWHFMSVSCGDYSWSMTSVQKWDIDGHQVGPTYRCPSKAFSTNDTHFISHCEGVFIVQNFDTGGIVAKCLVSNSSPNPSHFHSCTSPNGRLVAFSVIHTIYVWDITGSDPLLIETFTGHTNNILSLTFSSPSTLVSASMDQLVKFWQIGGLSADSVPGDPKPIPPISGSITSVSLQVGDSVAISCDFGGVVRVLDISTGLFKASFQTPIKNFIPNKNQPVIYHLCISPAVEGCKLHTWDAEKGELFKVVDIGSYSPTHFRISGDGSKVFGLVENHLQAWSTQTGEALGKVEVDHSLFHPLCMGDSRIWIHSWGGPIQGWDFGISGSSPVPVRNIAPFTCFSLFFSLSFSLTHILLS
jgi:WD40 repeat protein